MSRPTLALVAAKSGYSVATVSRALHNDASVVAATREHVLAVCREVGYQPSIAGRRLSQGNKAVVGLSLGVRDHATGRFVSLMHQALSSRLAASGWSVELITSAEFNESLDIGGLILVGLARQDARLCSPVSRTIPTVAIGHDVEGFCVAPDDQLGGELAARHLLGLRRKRLALLHTRDPDGSIAMRNTAFAAEVRKAGIEPMAIEASAALTPALEGYRAVHRLLAAGTAFDAIFCETDELALGAVAAVEDAGLSVPRDVAVVGFDDLPLIAARLTTIRQDFPKMAEAAIKLLAEARRGLPPRSVLMPVELVRRETT
jgi:LacI family transcriptional regulator